MDSDRVAKRLTHRIAAAIHSGMADRDLTIRELAQKIGQSEQFIRRLLVAENGVAEVLKTSLIADICAILDMEPIVSFSHKDPIKQDHPVVAGAPE